MIWLCIKTPKILRLGIFGINLGARFTFVLFAMEDEAEESKCIIIPTDVYTEESRFRASDNYIHNLPLDQIFPHKLIKALRKSEIGLPCVRVGVERVRIPFHTSGEATVIRLAPDAFLNTRTGVVIVVGSRASHCFPPALTRKTVIYTKSRHDTRQWNKTLTLNVQGRFHLVRPDFEPSFVLVER